MNWKKLIALFFSLLIAEKVVSQTICYSDTKYHTTNISSNAKGLQKINGYISLCYNSKYMSFYVGGTLITLPILERTKKNEKDGNGYLIYSFSSDKYGLYQDQEYYIRLTYSKPRTLEINNTVTGFFYMMEFVTDQCTQFNPITNLDSLFDFKLKASKDKTEQKIEPEEKAPEIFTVVEEMPEFPGGQGEMMKYIQKNIQYPPRAKEEGISGKCFVKFVINADGSTSDVQVLKGMSGCKECDVEAKRLVESMPKWKPGKSNGKPVSVYFNLPINFTIK